MMELIRISNKKLKVMLTPSDMTRYHLNTDTLEENAGKTHRAFRSLLASIREQIDFEADDKHISVQYFPSRGGGCEMFISQLQEHDEVEGSDADMKTKEKTPPRLCSSLDIGNCFWRDFAYRFLRLEDLLAVCKRLKSIKYICQSAAFVDEYNRYVLFLSARCKSPFSIPDEIAFIVEYGSIENAAQIMLYISEHGTELCAHDAIDILSDFA